MAAGIGSRFGTGIKQLAKMSDNGEIIMDYSIYDAKEAGFDKVVFVIRKDIEEEFKAVIGNRIGSQIEVEYVYQELTDLPDGFTVPEGRKKPWGTGQAVLACKDVVKDPFVIINADDYYGKEAFVKLHDFLVNGKQEGEVLNMAEGDEFSGKRKTGRRSAEHGDGRICPEKYCQRERSCYPWYLYRG